MTLKDISVPLRRALTLTLQHSQCSAERVERGVGRCDPPGLWQSILWVSTVALTLFSHCLHVSLSTHTNIPYLSACCIMQDHSITQQQHWPSPLFTGISKIAFCDVKKQRLWGVALSLPRQCHINTCIFVWEAKKCDYAIRRWGLRKSAAAFKCCCYLKCRQFELFKGMFLKKKLISFKILQQLPGVVVHIMRQPKILFSKYSSMTSSDVILHLSKN